MTDTSAPSRRRFLGAAAASGAVAAVGVATTAQPASAHVPTDRMIDLRAAYALPPAAPVDPNNAAPAFAKAIAALAPTGGVVYVPPGDWWVNASVFLNVPNITLLGAGVRASRIRAIASAPTAFAVVSIRADYASVERLTVVGNRGISTLGSHGIRVGTVNEFEDRRGTTIRDVVVEQAFSYGLGFQQGSHQDVLIENVTVIDSGDDGLDFKNKNNSTTRAYIKNLSIQRHGVGTDNRGLDMRGKFRVQNIDVLEVTGITTGIAFRNDPVNPTGTFVNGLGAFYTTLSNYYISKKATATGIANSGITGVAIGAGSIVNY